jgi:hypothetical protein
MEHDSSWAKPIWKQIEYASWNADEDGHLLLYLLQATRHTAATDARDKVYALVGIFSCVERRLVA